MRRCRVQVARSIERQFYSTMVSESPAVARRLLRLALRKVRESQGVTQSQVAEALEWSLSKVNRIESGDVTVSNTDLRALLGFLGVTDSTTIERLTDNARVSRRRGWWDEAQYREHLSPATLQLLQFESEATAVRSFQPTFIPGLLQTKEYAEGVFDFWSGTLTEAARETRVAVRLRRRAQVLDRADPPLYYLIIEQSVVTRKVGGPAVSAEQLRKVLAVSEMQQAIIRILPLEHSIMSMLGSFTIFDLGDEENAVLYREGALGDEIIHSSDLISRHREIFEQAWHDTLTLAESQTLIRQRVAELVNQDQSQQPH
jgi:transcriptional regulator with XRE-family HTH domain